MVNSRPAIPDISPVPGSKTVYIDGVFREKIYKNLKKKQTWNIDKEYTFSQSVQIKLWDEDFGWGDGDDFLGETLINTSLGENKTAKFTLDDCDYTLTYSVRETTLVLENEFNQLLNEFEKSSAPGVWPNIDKTQLIDDIRAILANPLRVNQGRAPLCGPAAIVYELVRREPSRFVRICRSLYNLNVPFRKALFKATANSSVNQCKPYSFFWYVGYINKVHFLLSHNRFYSLDAHKIIFHKLSHFCFYVHNI
jgi:hypothetical protein